VARAILMTIVAALAGAAIASGGLFAVLREANGVHGWIDWAFSAAFCFVAYLISLCILAWPTVFVLSRMRVLSLPTLLAVGGTVATGIGGIAGFTSSPGAVLTLAAAGGLSGLAASFVLWRAVDPQYKVETEGDRYARTSGGARYFAFFSYARADNSTANWLWSKLDAYRTPKGLMSVDEADVPKRLHPIFRDRYDLTAGGRVSEQLERALLKSERLVLLCTPSAAKSKWVDYEVQSFIGRGREKHILPVIAAGEPDSGDPATECFPPSLRNRDILAADLRRIDRGDGQIVGDGLQDGALKLIAGLLGVDFDALVRRENARAQRRAIKLATVAAFSSALALLALLFGFVVVNAFAWNLRNLEISVEADFTSLSHIYDSQGLDAAKSYVTARRASGSVVCLALIDETGAVLATNSDFPLFDDGFPVPQEIGVKQTFTREITGMTNYRGSAFFVRTDGIVRRESPTLTIVAASCNLEPPLLYGVFRALFTSPARLRSEATYHVSP
jgi:hypothetical protein